MSWRELDPHIRTTAQTALTNRQLDVLKLHINGCGTRRIATMLSISEPTAREHLRIAKLRLAAALEEDAA